MIAALLLAMHLGNDPVAPFRIVGNVYYVGASDVTSYLITTPRGHIVLDGGFAETAPMIVANIRKLGFDPADVRLILNSHAHLDHAGGIAELRRITGAKFLASAPDTAQLARGGTDDPQFGNRFLFPPAPPDQLIRDNQRITLGRTTLTAHITPGHTRGCTTWTMRAGGRDVVFLCSATAPSEYRLTPDVVADYRRTFAILRSLPCDVFLGSHGGFFDLKGKVGHPGRFIDPAGYKAHIDALEASLNKRVQP